MKKILKVIDSVNLDKLLEYGFEEYTYDEEYRFYGKTSLRIQIKAKDRIVRLTNGGARETVVLFKMFQDGLLEETEIEDKKQDNLTKVQNQRDKYKDIIIEIEEHIRHEWFKREQIGIMDKSFQEWEMNKLLQIIEKAKEVE